MDHEQSIGEALRQIADALDALELALAIVRERAGVRWDEVSEQAERVRGATATIRHLAGELP